MSSEPVPSSSSQPPANSAEASAPLKPLLNPLQSDGPPPASTIVEPPRSPNPQNPAIDQAGNNAEMDLPSASASVVGPGQTAEPAEAVEQIEQVSAVEPTPIPSREDTAPPPLPTDAPLPPTPPQPTDEAPPVLPEGAIPPAVSTPTVITTEEPPAPIPTPPPEQSASAAAPASASQLDAASQPNGVSPAPPAAEAMDIDPKEENVVSPAPGMESRASEGSLKRAGDDLEGREEKRIKEDTPVAPAQAAPPAPEATPAPVAPAAPIQVAPASAPAPVPAPAIAPASAPAPAVQPAPVASLPLVDPNAPPLPWTIYVEPAPRPAGPTTPLTQVQHKHLLQSVRTLKKAKDAVNFLEPVNVVLFNIPHYAQIITKPMDLGTVEHKLIASDPRGPPKDKSKLAKWDESRGTYGSVSEVVADVRQIWENTRKFNGPQHVVSQMASKLDDMFERQLKNLPAEPLAPPTPVASSPAAGPSARRQSISQAPAIRRSSDGPDSSRPKREIHPPPSKDLGYSDGTARKPKRRNDPQVQWAARTIKGLETTQKFYDTVSPFLYPVEDIIAAIPDYARLIKSPIDLLKIKARLEAGEYDDFQQVDADMRLMIRNAKTFNPPQEPVHQCAVQLASVWDEKMKSMPAKQEARDLSEDPLADDFIDDASDEEDAEQITKLERQVASLQQQIADIRTRRAARKSRPKKTKKSVQRKQSLPKTSPGFGTNGHAKKPRKSRDIVYKDDDDAESEDDINGQITLAQKQELADKMGTADGDTLQKAITIIQQTQDLGSNNDEIELDIDSLPARTVLKLYNLVVRGRKTGRSKAGAKKTGRKATGGANRKFMNEDEEAERIRKMEEKLNTFEGAQNDRRGGFGNGNEYDEADEESSEEESSDDE